MKKFIIGFVAGWFAYKKIPLLIPHLEALVAKLELQRDILEHDNPDLR